MHHDRRLHQMMLAEDSKAWDLARGMCCSGPGSYYAQQQRGKAMHPPSCRPTALTSIAAADPCSAEHGSPTDSASSLHADCALHGECLQDSQEDISQSLLRCVPPSLPLAHLSSRSQ